MKIKSSKNGAYTIIEIQSRGSLYDMRSKPISEGVASFRSWRIWPLPLKLIVLATTSVSHQLLIFQVTCQWGWYWLCLGWRASWECGQLACSLSVAACWHPHPAPRCACSKPGSEPISQWEPQLWILMLVSVHVCKCTFFTWFYLNKRCCTKSLCALSSFV